MTQPTLIDIQFQERAGVISLFVFDTGDGLALVDCGPTTTLGHLEEGLGTLGAGLGDVRHLLLTHIHLDHAGAVGPLLERSPRAKVYVHAKGAPHLVSPERLIASATQIYGDMMDTLWGEMRPVDADRLQVVGGDETLRIGKTEVRALYTPGHAVHHLSYHIGDELYVGDVGGIRLQEEQSPRAPTPPPDISLELWQGSVDKLRALDARTLHHPHFGSYANTPAHWERLLESLHEDAEWVRRALEAGKTTEQMLPEFMEQREAELETEVPGIWPRYEYANPAWMGVQGLVRYWQKKAKAQERKEG